MKKQLTLLLLVVFAALLLTACGCEHEWMDADCLHPKTCSQCYKTEGNPTGHTWAAATCTAPKTCTDCGAITGDVLNHTWEEADCENPKTCSVCKATKGEALGHNADAATCEAASVCKVCSKQVAPALDHDATVATCEAPSVCKNCNKQLAPAADHDATEATCEEPSVCRTCNQELAPAKDHMWVDATTETPKTCSVCSKTEGTPLNTKHLGITLTDYVQMMNTSLEMLGMKIQYAGTTNDGILVYTVNRLLDSGDTTVQVGFYLYADGAHVVSVLCGTDYGMDNSAATIVGNCLGIAAYIADNTFNQNDLLALQSNVTISPDGKSYTYTHSKNSISYIMQVTQTSTGAELFTVIQPE